MGGHCHFDPPWIRHWTETRPRRSKTRHETDSRPRRSRPRLSLHRVNNVTIYLQESHILLYKLGNNYNENARCFLLSKKQDLIKNRTLFRQRDSHMWLMRYEKRKKTRKNINKYVGLNNNIVQYSVNINFKECRGRQYLQFYFWRNAFISRSAFDTNTLGLHNRISDAE